MAINSSPQKLNLASGLVAAAAHLTTAWEAVTKYNQMYVKSGLTFVAGDFDNSTLAYIDPTQMATLLTNLNAFVTWMNTGGNGDLCFKVSPAVPAQI